MHKFVKIGLVVLGAIGAILWSQLPEAEAPVGEAVESGAVHWMFMIMYFLLAVAVVFSLVFTLKNLFSNPNGLKKTLFGVVGFLVVVGIAYVLSDGADGTVEAMADRGVATTEGTVKNIGTGLNVFFILVVIAVASMFWGGLKKMMNK
ncbi:hypothetical protein OZ410_01940 [Robiginitalea sp. M366]|uniref:hypothetical protein n=1 Tax=Robiginitalea aestuariiviva TaxID=3036903 RepID=UPI00240E1C66|nr:hypothetical protein [Robiginitalea aestuariiviva]MDG1571061.1 hypothetical protein [Robiginitalea aestuariiviva]